MWIILGWEPSDSKSHSMTVLIKEIKMLAKKADQKLDTVKPRTSKDTNMIIKALMTSKKRPNVNSVKGKVRTIRIGLSRALANPKSKAATSRSEAWRNRMPSTMRLAAHSDKAVIVQ